MATELAPELKELLEKQAIAELVLNYSRAVDRQDLKLLRSLYTRDGIDDHGGLYCGSADGFVAWLETAMKGVETMHQVHNHLIAVHGDTAEGEAYLTTYNRIPDGKGGFNEFLQGLRYLDNYRKEDGRWRFARRTVTLDWAQHRPALWDFEHPLLKGKRPGRPDASDPSYEMLPSPTFARVKG
ncbi:MAG TPA: nuclear transport factor 2 family protein [Alphaproteobacteria bacterium]|nr:nuclear transport factor 2 family protein [Alphaproteobacteria bacterium]